MKVVMMPDMSRANPYQRLLAASVADHGVEVIFPRGYRRGLPLLRALRAAKADVLHLHWTHPYLIAASPTMFALRCQKLIAELMVVRALGYGIVWTVHNKISHESRSPEREYALYKRIGRFAHRTIIHSDVARAEIAAAYALPEDRIRVIPHGHFRTLYPPRAKRAEARAALAIPEHIKHVFLCFGLIRGYKGHDLLIRAWKRRARPDSLLIIAGKPHDAEIGGQLQASVGDDPSIKLILGFVPDEQIPILYGVSDAAVLPFDRITTSSTLLLAMSYGLPVIGPSLPLLTETLASAGDLLFVPGDEASLDAMIERASAVDLNDLAARTVAACDRFGWEAIGAATAAAYRESFT